MKILNRFVNWLKNLTKPKQVEHANIIEVPTDETIPEPPTPQPKTIDQVYEEITKTRKDQAKEYWLPKPTSKRRVIRDRSRVPAYRLPGSPGIIHPNTQTP